MKESYLYKKLENKKVQCRTCSQRCFIAENNFGICGVRKNIDGKLFALNYGKAISESIDPIEKKPLFHFLPGTNSLSVATVGCNLRCDNCQNWQISQLVKTDKNLLNIGENLSPEEIVSHAIKNKCPSISYTYTEPTIFLEYALDTMKLAREKNIKNIWVTNGFMSDETLDLILPYLDAANVDLKSFDDEFYKIHCGAKVKPVLENLEKIKKAGIWTEVTTLIIPTDAPHPNPCLPDGQALPRGEGARSPFQKGGEGDFVSERDEKMLESIARFIFNKLGSETPWHISAFSGAISYKMQNIPDTPVEKIHQAYETGKEAGLKYIYTGNILDNTRENTYCPNCDELVIKRIGFTIERFDKKGKCGKCGESVNLIL